MPLNLPTGKWIFEYYARNNAPEDILVWIIPYNAYTYTVIMPLHLPKCESFHVMHVHILNSCLSTCLSVIISIL